jgi:hypothetical protein
MSTVGCWVGRPPSAPPTVYLREPGTVESDRFSLRVLTTAFLTLDPRRSLPFPSRIRRCGRLAGELAPEPRSLPSVSNGYLQTTSTHLPPVCLRSLQRRARDPPALRRTTFVAPCLGPSRLIWDRLSAPPDDPDNAGPLPRSARVGRPFLSGSPPALARRASPQHPARRRAESEFSHSAVRCLRAEWQRVCFT